jgi:parallel beta helix pectate lyase-like protein
MRRAPFALALLLLASPSVADCLRVDRPQTVTGGTYACIVLTREASGSVLDGVTVQGAPGPGIELYADGVTIRNARVSGSGYYAIFVGTHWTDGKADFVPRGLVVEGGRLHENAAGIKWNMCDGCAVRRVRIDHNRGNALEIALTSGLTEITDNELDHNGVPGVVNSGYGIYTTEPMHFWRNRVHDNYGYGVHVWPGLSRRNTLENHLDIRFNRVYRNAS